MAKKAKPFTPKTRVLPKGVKPKGDYRGRKVRKSGKVAYT